MPVSLAVHEMSMNPSNAPMTFRTKLLLAIIMSAFVAILATLSFLSRGNRKVISEVSKHSAMLVVPAISEAAFLNELHDYAGVHSMAFSENRTSGVWELVTVDLKSRDGCVIYLVNTVHADTFSVDLFSDTKDCKWQRVWSDFQNHFNNRYEWHQVN